MPVRSLPSNPNVDHLKYQARDLLKEHAARVEEAAQRIREFHPRFGRASDSEIFDARLRLSDAQLAIAREYGFPSWTRLKRHIEGPTLSDRLDLPHQQRIEDEAFRRAVDLLDAGEIITTEFSRPLSLLTPTFLVRLARIGVEMRGGDLESSADAQPESLPEV